ncbi:PKD domain-containing protein [Massilia sp. HP4]|uniref:PKD domain-containing protein n=1 Tax=Massilia sp. HP4 TaxID=2562316 RepID=UPI0010C05802|nr:PKD domain-containing protein [Massilia sp. HP4]
MQARFHTGAARRAVHGIRPGLLCALLLAGTAHAQQPPAHETARKPHAGKTTYRVINLAAGDATSASINASGQVAYSLTPDILSLPINAFFYDGSTSRNVGSLAAPGDFARATGITAGGRVVGVSRNPMGNLRTFIWNRWTGIADIGTLPGTDDAIEPVVNSLGVITGIANSDTGINRGFRWSALLGMTDLGVLAPGPAESSYPRAINDAGTIVGDSWALANDWHTFRWTFGSGMVDIHTNGSEDSTPVGVTASGNVAGNYHLGGGVWRSYFWTPITGMVDIAPPGVPTWMTGLTANGRATGQVGDPFIPTHAMTWTQAGGLVDLGTFGGVYSSASGANNKGQVIGASHDGVQARAFVWTSAEGMVDLNTRLRHAPPGLHLVNAIAINDIGHIVAESNTGLVLLKPASKKPCGCPHTVGPIETSPMVAVGAPVDAAVSVAGDGPADYRVSWTWGDGATARSAGKERASASHSYTRPGIHTVTATVTDRAGKSVEVSRKVIAYTPGNGGAAGSGSFVSPLAAGHGRFRQAGLARFNFIVPATGQSLQSSVASPPAQSALHFEAGGLSFVSKDVRARGGRGHFDGSGTVNGKAGYRFALTAKASSSASSEPGRMKLRIWQVDRATGKNVVVYDNGDASGGDGRVRAPLPAASGAGAIAGDSGSALAEGSIALD